MKILKKRILAFLIDALIFGLFFSFCQEALNMWFSQSIYWSLLLFLVYFVKDFAFRNASIGKKIVGIAIYSDNWEPPDFIVLFKRTVLMLTVGFFLFWRAKFIDGTIITFFDWERDVLKTRVIDKKVLKKLQQETESESENYCANMTRLYNEYLKNFYLK